MLQLFCSFSSYLTENSQWSPACISQRTWQIRNHSNLGETYIKGGRKKLTGRKCQENETKRWRKKSVILINGREEDSTRDADYGQITQLSGTLFPRSTLSQQIQQIKYVGHNPTHFHPRQCSNSCGTGHDRPTRCILLKSRRIRNNFRCSQARLRRSLIRDVNSYSLVGAVPPRIWRKQVFLKYWYEFTTKQCITCRKTLILNIYIYIYIKCYMRGNRFGN